MNVVVQMSSSPPSSSTPSALMMMGGQGPAATAARERERERERLLQQQAGQTSYQRPSISATALKAEKRHRKRRTSLLRAASNGNLLKLKRAIEKGGNASYKDQDGASALSFAARHGHVDCVAYLLSKGADVNCIDKEGKSSYYIYAVFIPTIHILNLALNSTQSRMYARAHPHHA